MNPFHDDIEDLEGPFEQTPGTTTGAASSGSSASSPTVEIVPDDGMTNMAASNVAAALANGVAGIGNNSPESANNTGTAGVVGDEIPSNHGAQGEKHFVSPMKSEDIPATHAVFEAKGISLEEFQKGYEWGEGGEAVSGEPLKRRVSRASTGKTILTIKVKGGDQVVDKMNVWVIWATCTPRRVAMPVFTKIKAAPAQQNPPIPAIKAFSTYGEVNSGNTWSFVFKIEPGEIITANEHPLLEGAQDKRHDVPGAGKPLPTNPNRADLHADEATYKWDSSRQIKWAITNSTGTTNPVAFPQDDTEGNDDPYGHGGDEDDIPYKASQLLAPSLAHDIGEISSTDGPVLGRDVDQGSTDGEIYHKDVDFREFARVQLWDGKRKNGKFWFRISDFVLWHHYFRAKFKTHILRDSTWEDDGSIDGQP